MKNFKKKELNNSNGITLIALVITIIVLLILAGISISMLSGDNGILQRATTAKENTERAEIIETAQMDILEKQTENHGSLSADELEEILISPNYNTQGRLSNEEKILERTLTSKNGKYEIPVSEIYNGSLSNTTPSVVTDYSNEVKTALAEGKYVTYKNKPYVVLYNDDNGIEIVAMQLTETITLGNNDEAEGAQGTKGESDRAIWSFNNAIKTLNKAAEDLFPSDDIIDDARSVGSVPGKTNGVSNKNTENSTPYTHSNENEYFSDYDNLLEQGEQIHYSATGIGGNYILDQANYTMDLNKMKSLNIEIMDDNYWLASRNINIYGGEYQYASTLPSTSVFVWEIDCDGGRSGASFWSIKSDKTINVSYQTSKLRPVLHLAYTAKIKEDGGDGSSSNPFVLE